MNKAVFWDLDGTLTNSAEGIFRSLEFAFQEFGYETPSREILQEFLGPPIVYSLEHFCGISPQECQAMYAKFRERYSTIGKFENELYDGIEDVLRVCKERGYFMSLATAKPEVFAKEILEHFSISQYFDQIVGADYSLNRIHKMDILKKAIQDYGHPLTANGQRIAYMIGDRRYDMEAAIELGCIPLGVTYGFGSLEELKEAKAELIANEPLDILSLLEI